MFVGITSYARPHIFRTSVLSLANTQVIRGIIAVIDVRSLREKEHYIKTLEEIRNKGLEVITDISDKCRGSTNARNRLLDLAEQTLNNKDILILYDDDYICPGSHALIPVKTWLKRGDIGLVGGRVINLRRRRSDPDFYLNVMPNLAEVLTKLTGFIFINTKHGPRYVEYTTSLMATRVEIIKKNIRYDPIYEGTGYREESDFQQRIREKGLKIIFEPKFYTYHLCLETGGNRAIDDIRTRFYWKSRNNTIFVLKNKLGLTRLILSEAIIIMYSVTKGIGTSIEAIRGLKDGLTVYRSKA